MNVNKQNAVKIEGNQAVLEVSYSIANVESDSNRFAEIIGGRYDTTKAQAIASVIESVEAWAAGMRADGHDVHVWDEQGNCY